MLFIIVLLRNMPSVHPIIPQHAKRPSMLLRSQLADAGVAWPRRGFRSGDFPATFDPRVKLTLPYGKRLQFAIEAMAQSK